MTRRNMNNLVYADDTTLVGRTDSEAEAPILWPPDVMSWLTGETLMLGKTESRRRMGP